MVYLVALAAGAFTVGILLAAGASGYAIANAANNRAAVLAVGIGAVALIGASGAVLGAVTYARITTPATAVKVAGQSSVAATNPTSSPQPAATPDSSDTLQPATDAWMHFDSDSGDYIGAGVLKIWTLKESNFSVGGTNAYLRASVSGEGDWWYLDFRAPSNGHLAPGMYTNAERAPFVTGKAPGLEVSGDGRGCNTLSGQFEIKSLTWTAAATVDEMDIVFVQHCETMSPALRGELWFTTRSGVHKTPPSAASQVTF